MAEDTIYQPINSHTGEIRLLVLSGSLCEDGSPEYVFKYAKLCDEPIFEALSYVWGDPTPVKLVLVDGVSTKVPRNLGIILPYLTSRLFSCPIWIDALCINQEDHREKGEQIALMGRIFSQAQHVLSWLGERPGPEEDDGWHRFEQRVLWQKYPPLLHTTHSKMSKERVATTSLLLNGLAMVKGHAMGAFRSILNRPYFTRLWVVQEVALAKSPIGMVGNITFDLQQLCGLAGRTMGEGPDTDWAALRLIRDAHQRGQPFTVMELLNLTDGFQVTDPRDRIVALLGIARDAGKIDFDTGTFYQLDTRHFLKAFSTAYIDSLQVYNGGVGEWKQVLSAMKEPRRPIFGDDVSYNSDSHGYLAIRVMRAIESSITRGTSFTWDTQLIEWEDVNDEIVGFAVDAYSGMRTRQEYREEIKRLQCKLESLREQGKEARLYELVRGLGL